MNKALSHSGPSAFGNGLIVSFIELPTLMHNGLKFEKKCCSIFVVSMKRIYNENFSNGVLTHKAPGSEENICKKTLIFFYNL